MHSFPTVPCYYRLYHSKMLLCKSFELNIERFMNRFYRPFYLTMDGVNMYVVWRWVP